MSRIKRALSGWGSQRKGFGEGSGGGEESRGSKSGEPEKITAMAGGAGIIHQRSLTDAGAGVQPYDAQYSN
ncbi:MAG: hypothetical protein R3F19_17510 [Verrucomicrobiales bacterium]